MKQILFLICLLSGFTVKAQPMLFRANLPSISKDTDATKYIDSLTGHGDILNYTETRAIHTLFRAAKVHGWYYAVYAMYLMRGGTATSTKWNAVNPTDADTAHRLSWSGGFTYDRKGVTGNGVNGFADPHISNIQAPVYGGVAAYSGSAAQVGRLWENDLNLPGYRFLLGYASTPNDVRFEQHSPTFSDPKFTNSFTNNKGFTLCRQDSSNIKTMYRNSVPTATQTGTQFTGTPVSEPIYFFAAHSTSGAFDFCNSEIGFFIVFRYITDQQAVDMSNDVNQFMKNLGQNEY